MHQRSYLDTETYRLAYFIKTLVHLGLMPMTKYEYWAMDTDKVLLYIDAFGVEPW
jgi:hypothetical protein